MIPSANHDDLDPFRELFDDLDSLPRSPPQLSESIFARTRGVLSRRRWFRRGRMVLACLMCYAVGIGSGWFLKPSLERQLASDLNVPTETSNAISELAQHNQPAAEEESKHASNSAEAEKSSTKVAVTTPVNNGRAVRPVGSPFQSLRRAGDRQLYERGNIRGAMDCYRRALSHATETELRVEINRDSWLLMSLKQSRLEERKHARQKRA